MRNSFTPDDMALLMRVVDQACSDLGGCDDVTKSHMATRVLACASQGERDPDLLLSIAVNGQRRLAHAG